MANTSDIVAWFRDGLEVRQSLIHGQGLYTTSAVAFEHEILRLGGHLFPFDVRHSGSVMRSTAISLSDDVLLAEPSSGNKDYSDFLNHSCEPNIGLKDAISIIAIRDIAAGAELVIDYSFWEGDSTWRLKYLCNCGAPGCRRNITGEDWKNARVTEERFHYYSPFLKRRILAHALTNYSI